MNFYPNHSITLKSDDLAKMFDGIDEVNITIHQSDEAFRLIFSDTKDAKSFQYLYFPKDEK